MNMKEGDKIQFEEYVSRIRFKPLEVDTDAVYKRLHDRIETSRQRIGVSPIWKYTSVAACIALLCVSSFLIIPDCIACLFVLPAPSLNCSFICLYK